MNNEAKWIPDPTYSQLPPIYICSHCKREAFEDYIEGQQMFRYCPYCGCYMVNYEDFDHSDD